MEAFGGYAQIRISSRGQRGDDYVCGAQELMKFTALGAIAEINVGNLLGLIQFDEHRSVAGAIIAVPVTQPIRA
jgi:hypothetical protein